MKPRSNVSARILSAVAAALSGCCACAGLAGCAESELEPQVPVNAQAVEHEKMRAPDIRDGFMQVAQPSYDSAPHSPGRVMWPRQTVSLGFIGDDPVGAHDYDPGTPPPHAPPAWTRPFPREWTRSHYGAGYGYGYGGDRGYDGYRVTPPGWQGGRGP